MLFASPPPSGSGRCQPLSLVTEGREREGETKCETQEKMRGSFFYFLLFFVVNLPFIRRRAERDSGGCEERSSCDSIKQPPPETVLQATLSCTVF